MELKKLFVTFAPRGEDKVDGAIKRLTKALNKAAIQQIKNQQKISNELLKAEGKVGLELKKRNAQKDKYLKSEQERFKKELAMLGIRRDYEKEIATMRKDSNAAVTAELKAQTREHKKQERMITAGAGTAIKATAVLLGAWKLGEKLYNWSSDTNRRAVQWGTVARTAGENQPFAQGMDFALQKFGGSMGEGISQVGNINAALGAMQFGDTGLMEVAGKFGVAVNPMMSERDFFKTVANRAKGMTDRQQLAMFNAFGYSPAMQAMTREAITTGDFDSVFDKYKEAPVYPSKENMQTVAGKVAAERSVFQAETDVASAMAPLQQFIDSVIAAEPALKMAKDVITSIAPMLAGLVGLKFFLNATRGAATTAATAAGSGAAGAAAGAAASGWRRIWAGAKNIGKRSLPWLGRAGKVAGRVAGPAGWALLGYEALDYARGVAEKTATQLNESYARSISDAERQVEWLKSSGLLGGEVKVIFNIDGKWSETNLPDAQKEALEVMLNWAKKNSTLTPLINLK